MDSSRFKRTRLLPKKRLKQPLLELLAKNKIYHLLARGTQWRKPQPLGEHKGFPEYISCPRNYQRMQQPLATALFITLFGSTPLRVTRRTCQIRFPTDCCSHNPAHWRPGLGDSTCTIDPPVSEIEGARTCHSDTWLTQGRCRVASGRSTRRTCYPAGNHRNRWFW